MAIRRPAPLVLGDREIRAGGQPFVIAEISANHRGGKDVAVELVRIAAECGADAVKFQHYTPDTMTVESDHPDFRISGGTLWDGRTLFDLYSDAMTPWEWTEDLVTEADRAGIVWFSTPFDASAVDYLTRFDVSVFKIASFEIVDLPLISYAASKGRPLIISTGMASIGEIDAAVTAGLDGGAPALALLRCSSSYPAESSEMDLLAIPVMHELWDVPIGLSDHTLTDTSAIAATALGACIVEKHLTIRRSDGGPDSAFSLEPAEFTRMVSAVRETRDALGRVRFGPTPSEVASKAFRRSLRAVKAIARGESLTGDNVRSMRPAGGLHPDQISLVIGMVASRDLVQGDPIDWSCVAAPTS